MITEDAAGTVSGGAQMDSQWENYLSVQVMPILSGLMNGASENDRAILRTIYQVLQDTIARHTNMADTIGELWANYNFVYRPVLQSSKIQMTLDQKLYSAKQFADSHG